MMKLTLAQKILLLCLYGLFMLMIIFSVLAVKNIGKQGFDRCIEKKCQDGGEQFCAKFREVNNCCLGAGGATAMSSSKAICVFT